MTLSIPVEYCYDECRKLVLYVECRYADCHYAECRSAKKHNQVVRQKHPWYCGHLSFYILTLALSSTKVNPEISRPLVR
jgi:hypothetical protein